jgi:hypothetical protein
MTMTLNTDLLLEIADHIERRPEKFDLGLWSSAHDADEHINDCGTTGCVAGWANALTGAESFEVLCDSTRAANKLGLNDDQAARLFLWSDSVWCDLADDLGLEVYNKGTNFRGIDLTGHLAAKGLRMIASGEVAL